MLWQTPCSARKPCLHEDAMTDSTPSSARVSTPHAVPADDVLHTLHSDPARGRDAREVMDSLRGIPCRGSTSCPDQLSRAIEQYLNQPVEKK